MSVYAAFCPAIVPAERPTDLSAQQPTYFTAGDEAHINTDWRSEQSSVVSAVDAADQCSLCSAIETTVVSTVLSTNPAA